VRPVARVFALALCQRPALVSKHVRTRDGSPSRRHSFQGQACWRVALAAAHPRHEPFRLWAYGLHESDLVEKVAGSNRASLVVVLVGTLGRPRFARKIDPLAIMRRSKKAADDVRPLTLHLALTELFRVALVSGEFKGENAAEKIQKASAHWLRHTLATQAVASGTPIGVVAGIFGHANFATTSIYI
jgi:hypothetical protein